MLQQVITRFQFLSGFSCVAIENTGMEMKTKPTHEITEFGNFDFNFLFEFSAPRLQLKRQLGFIWEMSCFIFSVAFLNKRFYTIKIENPILI